MNVIVILADSLRFDYVGCYGNKRIKTPNIDRLASEGTIFKYAYSEGVPTIPARTALFTGRYTFPFRGWQPLEINDVVLSEVLHRNRFYTAFISDSFPLHTHNFTRGFHYVQWIWGQWGIQIPYKSDVNENVKIDVSKYHKDSGRSLADTGTKRTLERILRFNLYHYKNDGDSCVARIIKAAIKWLESNEDNDRFLLWLDCFDPHEPWDTPPPYNRMYTDPDYDGKDIILPVMGEVDGYLNDAEINHIRALYAGEVTMEDKWIGIFLEKLSDLGLLDNTLIIFLSDHGEPFGEHGIILKARPWPYEELTHIPLIIKHPKGIGKGSVIEAFVDTTDVMPTILDFLEIPSKIPSMHGQSLMPLLSKENEKVRDYAYSGYYARSWSIRDKEWKYILWLKPMKGFEERSELHAQRVKPELYNLKYDSAEKDNVFNEESEIADALELQLRRFVDGLTPSVSPYQADSRLERIR